MDKDPEREAKARVGLTEYMSLYDRNERMFDLDERSRSEASRRASTDTNADLTNATERLMTVVSDLDADDHLRRAALRVQNAHHVWMAIDTETNPAFEDFMQAAGDEYHAAVKALREALADG